MKTLLSYKGFDGSAEIDVERQVCRGKLLFIPDLVTFEADSPKELQQEFEAAVEDYLATCAELGRKPFKPFRGSFNVRVPPELHRSAAVHAAQENLSLNDVVVRALDCYLNGRTDVHNHNNFTVRLETAVRSVTPGSEPTWKEFRTVGTSDVH